MNTQLNQKTPGRNDPCPCGSGKKYKKCCLGKDQSEVQSGNKTTHIPVKSLVPSMFESFSAGDLNRARSIAESILQLSPKNIDANHILGLIEFSSGNLNLADEHLKKAVNRSPSNAHIYTNYGKLLLAKGEPEKAEQHLKTALKIDSGLVEALNTYGNILLERFDFRKARECYEKAFEIDPSNVESINGRLYSIFKIGDPGTAEKGFLELIETNKQYIAGYINLATLYRDEEKYEEAIKVLEWAIGQDPYNAELYNLLGSLQIQIGKEKDGINSYKQSIKINPDYLNAYYNLFELLERKNDIEESLELAESLIQSTTWKEVNPIAIKIFGRAAAMEQRRDYFDKVVSYLMQHTSSCRNIYPLLLPSNYLDNVEVETLYNLHTCWAREKFKNIAELDHSRLANKSVKHQKIRVGYISSDFRMHSVGFFIQNILANSNLKEFDVYCYSFNYIEDEITKFIKDKVSKFVNIHEQTANGIAKKIYSDEVDILIDLAGHTSETIMEVMARKPAPVQVTYLGYPNTTGLNQMDYRITDRYADTEGGTKYVEEKIEMPECFLSFGEFSEIPIENEPPYQRNEYITFGSFNNIQKINMSVVKTWSEILNREPDSKLLIKDSSLKSAIVQANLSKIFGKYGIEKGRLIFKSSFESIEDHLAYYNNIDIALDPFPYNGTTTTCEALWMGVPVVTLVGQLHAQRVSYSILKNIGVEETIAESREHYVEIAVKLVKEHQFRDELRKKFRDQLKNSILCDTKRFTLQLENIYKYMWNKYNANQGKSAH